MERKLKKSFQTALALVLCLATAFTVGVMPVSAADAGAELLGSTAKAATSTLTVAGVTADRASDAIVSTDEFENPVVETDTLQRNYARMNYVGYNLRYLIMHEKTKNIMSYSAGSPSATASSIRYDANGNGDNVFYFTDDTEGTLVIDHSDRDESLWILNQSKNTNYGNVLVNDDGLPIDENGKVIAVYDKNGDLDPNDSNYILKYADGEEVSYVTDPDTIAKNFIFEDDADGPNKRYHHVNLRKGVGSTWNENGTINKSNNGSYWYSTDDAELFYRYLTFGEESEFLTQGKSATINIEYDEATNTFVVYRRASKSEYHILKCDENGQWSFEKHTGTNDAETAAAIKANLDDYRIRLYRYASDEGNKEVKLSGEQTYYAVEGTSNDALVSYIEDKLTAVDTNRKNLHIPFNGTEAKVGYCWLEFDNPLDASTSREKSDYVVKVNYRNDDGSDTLLGRLNVHIVDQIIVENSFTDIDKEGLAIQSAGTGYHVQKYAEGSTTDTEDCSFKVTVITATGSETKKVPITVGMLKNADGTLVNTAVNGTTENLILTYGPATVATDFKLTIEDSNSALNYPVYPEEGSVKVSKTGKEVGVFNETGVGNIQLSTTGIPLNKGVDIITILDLSGSMDYGVNSTSAPKADSDEETRIYALQESLRSMLETLNASDVDFRIAMSDFGDLDIHEFEDAVVDKENRENLFFDGDMDGHWDQQNYWAVPARGEYFNHLNYVHASYGQDVRVGTSEVPDVYDNRAVPFQIAAPKYNRGRVDYTGKIVPTVYTGSGEVNASAFVDVSTYNNKAAVDALLEKIYDNQQINSLGTNYDVGLEYAYQLGYAIQQENIANGNDRDIICIFMSDGAAMQYNYFTGRANGMGWADWLKGEIDPDALQSDTVNVLNDLGDFDLTKLEAYNRINDSMVAKLKNADAADTVINSLLYKPLRRLKFTPYEKSISIDPDTNEEKVEYKRQQNDRSNNIPRVNGGKDADGNNIYYFRITNNSTYETDGTLKEEGNYIYDMDAFMASTTFTEALSHMGVNPTWEFLTRVADANGLAGTYTSAADMDQDVLLNLLLTKNEAVANGNASMLVYPCDEDYYPRYTGTETDFFEIMKELGHPVETWEQFVKIATVNGYGTKNISASVASPTEDCLLSDLYFELTTLADGKTHGTLSPYSYFYNEEGKNWYAEAIKGSSTKLYPVINKYAFSDSTERAFGYYGDVRNNFSTGTGLALDSKDYISGYRGLDIPIYTVGLSLCSENYLTEDIAKNTLRNIASGPNYAFSANNRDELTNVFNTITNNAAQAARGAYFVDTMGEDYDLLTTEYVQKKVGENQFENLQKNEIRVLEYTLDSDGNRVENAEPSVRETITFDKDADGNLVVNSNLIYDTVTSGDVLTQVPRNIYNAETGLISGRYVRYNMTSEPKGIDLTGDGVNDYTIKGETFFWIVGTIGKTELTLDYNVYLEGSMEGELEDFNAYETNESAVLGYVNHLGNNAEKDTITPAFPWPDAFVGYAFYLVDGDGNPINKNGDICSFTDSVKLASPKYEHIDSNNTASISALDMFNENEELQLGFSLFDSASNYSVTSYSSGEGAWTITKSKAINSTYVTNYGGVPTNVLNGSEANVLARAGVSYDRTIAWFAVTSNYRANPDTVVVDYGLPVDIDVLSNDNAFINNYSLKYVGAASGAVDGKQCASTPTVTTTDKAGTFGELSKKGDKVTYTPNTSNGMLMSEEETFLYSAYFAGDKDGNAVGYYENTVTVIPATSIYFEDNFVDYKLYSFTDVNATAGTDVTNNADYAAYKWTDATDGNATSATQAEDRPGEYPIGKIDANNVYGSDAAYGEMSKYSLGSAKKITVGEYTVNGQKVNVYGTASFKFTGTGFDIISLTSKQTGTISVQVKDLVNSNNKIKGKSVDTYYGYKWQGDQWVVDEEATGALYQIPVMKMDLGVYSTYEVTITATFAELFDHGQYEDNRYDFYLDAIRIYNPAGTGDDNAVIKEAYLADGEYKPIYTEVRDLILNANSFDNVESGENVTGAIFIDGRNDQVSIADYKNYGPNNEVYLAQGQSIAFEADITNMAKLQLAMKSVDGNVKVKVYNANEKNASEVEAQEIKTATDLYHDITELAKVNNVIVIQNASDTDAVLSVTNLKLTTSEATGAGIFRMSKRAADVALKSLQLPTDELEPAETLAFNGASLTLYDNIAINFKAAESLFTEAGFENPYAVFTLGGKDYTVTDYTVQNGRVVFEFDNISPANMNDKVTAKLYASFGGKEYVSSAVEYSVADYCYNMLSKCSADEYASFRTLLVDLLNYGAATQIYTGYNTDNIVNAKLTEEQKAFATSEAPAYETVQDLKYEVVDNPTVSWLGGGLNLEDSVTMRFKISSESYEGLTVKAEIKGAQWELDEADFEIIDGCMYVYFSELNAAQMSEPVFFTVMKDGEAVSNTICYSVESYAYAKQNDADESLVNLLEAMMKYGNSANIYATEAMTS